MTENKENEPEDLDNLIEKNESIDDKIKKFPPLLRKILNYRHKNSEGLSLPEICRLTNQSYKSVTNTIYKQKKKDNDFSSLLHEIERELIIDRKIRLDNKFYKLLCESSDLEEVRKSIKTFYELNRLLPTENKQQINIQTNISIPISVKDTRPVDIEDID